MIHWWHTTSLLFSGQDILLLFWCLFLELDLDKKKLHLPLHGTGVLAAHLNDVTDHAFRIKHSRLLHWGGNPEQEVIRDNFKIVPQLFSSSKGSQWKCAYLQELCWWLHDGGVVLIGRNTMTPWTWRTCSMQMFLRSHRGSSSEVLLRFCCVSGALKETRAWTSVLSWFYNPCVLSLLSQFNSVSF